jgi:hypothetical protein
MWTWITQLPPWLLVPLALIAVWFAVKWGPGILGLISLAYACTGHWIEAVEVLFAALLLSVLKTVMDYHNAPRRRGGPE